MVVSVKFFGAQRALTHTREIQVSLSKNGRVDDVFVYLMNSYPELPLRKEDVLVTVNNKSSSMNYSLQADDNIVFLPHIGGG